MAGPTQLFPDILAHCVSVCLTKEKRMPRPAADLRAWARIGAHQRLQQLDQERQAILRTFPELRRAAGAPPSTNAAAPGRRRRRRRGPMPAAQKRALSQRMKKIWAERKRKNQG